MESSMSDLKTLLSGISFGEQPRWHENRLWFSDWGPREVIAVDLKGNKEVILRAPSFPCCVDWLPDGRLLVVSGRDGHALRLFRDLELGCRTEHPRTHPHHPAAFHHSAARSAHHAAVHHAVTEGRQAARRLGQMAGRGEARLPLLRRLPAAPSLTEFSGYENVVRSSDAKIARRRRAEHPRSVVPDARRPGALPLAPRR